MYKLCVYLSSINSFESISKVKVGPIERKIFRKFLDVFAIFLAILFENN